MAFLSKIPILRGLLDSRSSCELECDSEPSRGVPIFIIIHGTWAVDAPWTLRRGMLAEALKMAWPDAGIFRFKWSGLNGLKHRVIAAEEFTEALKSVSRDYPDSEVSVIAHSHGGNVAAWGSSRTYSNPKCAIYLNTPFTQILRARRQSNETSFPTVWAIAAVVTLCITWPLFAVLHSSSVTMHWFATARVWLVFAVLVSLVAAIRLNPMLRNMRYDLETYCFAERRIPNELSVSVVGDEVSSLMVGLYFTQFAFSRLSTFLTTAVPYLFMCFVVDRALEEFNNPNLVFVSSAPMAIALVVTGIGCIVNMATYGSVQGIISVQTKITASLTPLGSCDFRLVARQEVYLSTSSVGYMLGWLTQKIQYKAREVNWFEELRPTHLPAPNPNRVRNLLSGRPQNLLKSIVLSLGIVLGALAILKAIAFWTTR
jgi:hypothetical protein